MAALSNEILEYGNQYLIFWLLVLVQLPVPGTRYFSLMSSIYPVDQNSNEISSCTSPEVQTPDNHLWRLDLTCTNQHAPSKTALLPNPEIFDVCISMHNVGNIYMTRKHRFPGCCTSGSTGSTGNQRSSLSAGNG
jgi:hypothetical protein